MGFFSKLFGIENTSQADLEKAIAEGAFLVDVRSNGEFKSGSVKGAVNIPVENITREIAKFNNKKHIIVFCRSGNRSSMAKRLLNEKGINNVLNGGTWQAVNQLVKSK